MIVKDAQEEYAAHEILFTDFFQFFFSFASFASVS